MKYPKKRYEKTGNVCCNGCIELNGDMTCKSFSASTTGSGDIEVGMITADRIKASSSGKGNISLVCKDVGDIEDN